VTVVRRRDTASVDAAERPSNEHYRRFLTLVRQGTRTGWPQAELARSGRFRVLDAGFSAMLARACADLAWLAGELGEREAAVESAAQAEHVAGALAARAGADGLVRALDLTDETTLAPVGAGSALAALSPSLGGRAVRTLRDLVAVGPLASPFGVRSLDRDHPESSARNYWRGPVWANVTWLCALGLEGHGEPAAARELRGRMARAVEGGGMREYFVASSGRGIGARDFAWTAALYLRERSLGGGFAERVRVETEA
jgi:glycogen debranching enzyme